MRLLVSRPLRIPTAKNLAQKYKMLKYQEHLIVYVDGWTVHVVCYVNGNRSKFFEILKIPGLSDDSIDSRTGKNCIRNWKNIL